jgi:cytidylate kinase
LKKPLVITIDGPAASGKSSVGKILADKLNYMFLDTGEMYRAVTWAVLNKGVPVENEEKVSKLAESINMEILPGGEGESLKNIIIVDNKNITGQIRSKAVNDNVSQVSKYKTVRQVLTKIQQKIGSKGRIVMAGRDIGTVVLPDADLKIFLKASAEERAKRRYAEEQKQGNNISFLDVLNNVMMRDGIDSNRKIAPLIPATDAHIIDTNNKNVLDVVDEILRIIMGMDSIQ